MIGVARSTNAAHDRLGQVYVYIESSINNWLYSAYSWSGLLEHGDRWEETGKVQM